MIISEWIDTENEKNAILDLTRKVFGDVEIAIPSYFDWQYRNNPRGKAIVVLARDEKNNSIIGTNTVIPTQLIIDQKTIASSLACNVQVDPNHRKQGIFSKLLASMPAQALKKEISCLYAVPNDKSFNAFIKQGSIEIIQLPLLIRPLKLSKYFDGWVRSLLQPLDNIWKIRKNDNSTIELFEKDYDIGFNVLSEKASKRVSVIQKRDKEFLQWRYKNHPTRKYQTFVLRENSILKGYIITRHAVVKRKTIGVIVDFLVDAETQNQKNFKDLVNAALEDFWKNGISIVVATCRSGLLENTILHKAGFFTPPPFMRPESLHFIVTIFDSNNTDLEKLKVFGNWFFTFGDYDIF